MGRWADFGAWRRRRRELLAEEQERALAREARGVREAFAAAQSRPMDAVEVRWGRAEDAAGIAELLELNGMPRWVAFEERFVVAEEEGEVRAAVRYRQAPGRLLLGLLVVDPWAGEDRLTSALREGARKLASARGLEGVEVAVAPPGRPGGGAGLGRWHGIRHKALAAWALWGRAGTPPFFSPFRDRIRP